MIRSLISGGIITNYQCTASCKHCLYKSSPKRDKNYIEEHLLQQMLLKSAELGCRSFHIGGGEPFLNPELLLKTVRMFKKVKIGLDYLETNGSWFNNPQSAELLLKELQAAGCGTIMISVCPFHIEYIPLMKVDGVINACRKVEMNFFLWQEQYYAELSKLDKTTTHSHKELMKFFGDDYILNTAQRYGLTLNGRSLKTLNRYLSHYSVEEILGKNPGGCNELEQSSHFHLDLYGNYIPPGCVGLSLSFKDLGREITEQKYPHFKILSEKGICALFEYSHLEYGYEAYPEGYISKCDLCLSIREFILNAENYETKYNDLNPVDFYSRP